MTSRNEMLLGAIGRNDPIIEVGPSFNPVAPRSAGWNTVVVDHDTREALVEKYRSNPAVDGARIEEVDLLWHGGPLHSLFPEQEHGRFRALIACHVLEHLPDPLGFLRSCATLLRAEDGLLLLAVPDKRWCFDVFQPLTNTGHWLAAQAAAATRHAPATQFGHIAYTAALGDRIGWGREALEGLRLFHPLEVALREWRPACDAEDAPYRDAHAWHFTPASFQLLILEAAAAGACDWRVDWIAPQPAVEFLVQLSRGTERFASPEVRDARRLELLRATLLELREQSDWLVPQVAPLPVLPPALPPEPAPPSEQQEAMQRQITEIAETAAMLRTALRPARAVWRRLLPLRRLVARMRGRL